ncbi:hypothetical protein PVK06_021368 [Gossypium arboreum]|uniref:Uncharacterized protein n=1 Tax=Gossypium arboreum TaxID=29729 RepID=A0ABR0PQC6_GOSAR|nr:hypothetical protein PVK06_021368 [Gossypium arboreum]
MCSDDPPELFSEFSELLKALRLCNDNNGDQSSLEARLRREPLLTFVSSYHGIRRLHAPRLKRINETREPGLGHLYHRPLPLREFIIVTPINGFCPVTDAIGLVNQVKDSYLTKAETFTLSWWMAIHPQSKYSWLCESSPQGFEIDLLLQFKTTRVVFFYGGCEESGEEKGRKRRNRVHVSAKSGYLPAKRVPEEALCPHQQKTLP